MVRGSMATEASSSPADFDIGADQNLPSVLFRKGRPERDFGDQPECFIDLNLDQAVASIAAGRDEYDIKTFFYEPLQHVDDVIYRQEVFRDLDDKELRSKILAFGEGMRGVRDLLKSAARASYEMERQAWFLDAVHAFSDLVKNLTIALCSLPVTSRGFFRLRRYLDGYVHSETFSALSREADAIKDALGEVLLSIVIGADGFQVKKPAEEQDYNAAVERTFQKFRQGQVKNYKVSPSTDRFMNHIEAAIVAFAGELYPDVFKRLADYCAANSEFIDPVLASFDREVQFYLAYLDHTEKLAAHGLPFCYPDTRRSLEDTDVFAHDAFDIALAEKLVRTKGVVVVNDFMLRGRERILVVTGPNQGGKTTFARMFGQMHYLASLGCPVPGRKAKLILADAIWTHFEREENLESQQGKLQDDLFRIRQILLRASPDSIVLLNEIFTSTMLEDAVYLSRRVMTELIRRGVLAVWVTFIEELANFSEETVSVVSGVRAADPTVRTFKIERRAPDGLSHAMSIARKYGVTRACLMERLRS